MPNQRMGILRAWEEKMIDWFELDSTAPNSGLKLQND